MRRRSVIPVLVVVWLLVGAVAAGQRGYMTTDHDCATFSSTLVTIFVGPLNYLGVNPEVDCPELPEPSE
ncbi:hypothetical protein JQS43_19260 [Natronosporangium hydrolyticum]|uniref:Uncharacterized protein n=1 Tax=Natronosporangium hydrolyticum TaxID=2811111 RepID=A0A895Y7I2_9ACTN|nr:hypothetical protein [Natronosporangium hydrolyticum]QSB13694.1 hypothetical protein JQS43_19260 [Natronosporangium hydrolyticum]